MSIWTHDVLAILGLAVVYAAILAIAGIIEWLDRAKAAQDYYEANENYEDRRG
jgi:hypothetical protein